MTKKSSLHVQFDHLWVKAMTIAREATARAKVCATIVKDENIEKITGENAVERQIPFTSRLYYVLALTSLFL